ncbi:CASP-like protein 1E2 [Cinnamomum micranthum f. kanehirae]|uniref:CASP-like protein n=1 Tax=Cinnamomum micranthum f. kanehirae TaxID=337451 RepID=A0A3S3PNR1_9MAGN|nr:CASP-like protein 1E2 [Cinnamomum micranthum f. kanehirae]
MENEYKNNHVKVANPKPFRFSNFLLRILAMATTFVAAIVMGLAKETETVPFVLIPGTDPLFVPVSAKMRYSSSFVFFVVANAIACAYSAFSLLVTIGGSKGSRALALGITILDVIMVALLFSGNGAATTVGLLGYKGNSHVGWNKVCNTFEKFCRNVMASLIVSQIGSISFVLLVAISIFDLHRRSP